MKKGRAESYRVRWENLKRGEDYIESTAGGGDVGIGDGDLAMGVTEKIKGKSVRERDSVSFWNVDKLKTKE